MGLHIEICRGEKGRQSSEQSISLPKIEIYTVGDFDGLGTIKSQLNDVQLVQHGFGL